LYTNILYSKLFSRISAENLPKKRRTRTVEIGVSV
jgi:hypothetical protein